jgi:hypothetical protein
LARGFRIFSKATPRNSSAALAGSFASIFQFEKLEIHTVSLRFSNFNLSQNLSAIALASLRGAAQKQHYRQLCLFGKIFLDYCRKMNIIMANEWLMGVNPVLPLVFYVHPMPRNHNITL